MILAKDKVSTRVQISNVSVDVEFDVEVLEDGSLKLTFRDAIIIPPGHFLLGTIKDWR